MNEQEMVDHFARLAKPRLLDLLRLKVPHIYDDTPGQANSTVLADNVEISLKLKKTLQPYAGIERFVNEEKEMGFLINPGLIPLVKAITGEVRGRQLLVTRKIAARDDDRGVFAHVDGFGVRVVMYKDADHPDTHLVWECLYGVA